jgi:hypothetical protein
MKDVREAYKKDLFIRNEIARKEAERIEQERREAEERERKRLEDERIEKERLEAQAREEARLAEEARIAAEHERIEHLARNAPEFALIMRQDQENMQRRIDRHETLLTTILSTLQSINERLPLLLHHNLRILAHFFLFMYFICQNLLLLFVVLEYFI